MKQIRICRGKKVINIEHLVHKKTKGLSRSHPIPMVYWCRARISQRTQFFLNAGYVLCRTHSVLDSILLPQHFWSISVLSALKVTIDRTLTIEERWQDAAWVTNTNLICACRDF